MSKQPTEWLLANDHASVTLSSLVYDPAENDLLVAAFTVATAVELLAAIKAQLEKHGRNTLRAIDLAIGFIRTFDDQDGGAVRPEITRAAKVC